MGETPMNVDDLNDAVAREVMGWREERTPWDKWRYWATPDGKMTGYTQHVEWSPATRWDHAGQVLERMKALGCAVHLYCGTGGPTVDWLIQVGEADEPYQSDRGLSGPEAICRAALAAIRARGEGGG